MVKINTKTNGDIKAIKNKLTAGVMHLNIAMSLLLINVSYF